MGAHRQHGVPGPLGAPDPLPRVFGPGDDADGTVPSHRVRVPLRGPRPVPHVHLLRPRQAQDLDAGAPRLLGDRPDRKILPPHPPGEAGVREYNVLQKFGYFLLFAVSVVQSFLGFAIYWPAQFAFVSAVFGDAVYMRIWHTTIMWLFLSFTALHVYLVVTEDSRLVKAMVDGYYYRKAADGK
ncbi:MAG: cytochrome b/b6 domain-containing protein [Deltaproteobacteria bacterium]|nr:cytochrome b/b6 domain-containing protein [Deltaproteobacteria bacterium]